MLLLLFVVWLRRGRDIEFRKLGQVLPHWVALEERRVFLTSKKTVKYLIEVGKRIGWSTFPVGQLEVFFALWVLSLQWLFRVRVNYYLHFCGVYLFLFRY